MAGEDITSNEATTTTSVASPTYQHTAGDGAAKFERWHRTLPTEVEPCTWGCGCHRRQVGTAGLWRSWRLQRDVCLQSSKGKNLSCFKPKSNEPRNCNFTSMNLKSTGNINLKRNIFFEKGKKKSCSFPALIRNMHRRIKDTFPDSI